MVNKLKLIFAKLLVIGKKIFRVGVRARAR
jgi:hypothetical protein